MHTRPICYAMAKSRRKVGPAEPSAGPAEPSAGPAEPFVEPIAPHRRAFPYLPCTMVSEILPRSRSTFSTHTFTVSPTATTSLGCLTKRLAILEMCTRPS